MEQIVLVKVNQKVVGWIAYDMLENEKTLCECMDSIGESTLISSDTPLLEAIQIVCKKNDAIFLVLKRNQFIGWLHYDHFYKLPFRMCLFSLLIDLEEMLLKLTKSDPTSFLSNLENRINNAKKKYMDIVAIH